jgi:hypothetical protein
MRGFDGIPVTVELIAFRNRVAEGTEEVWSFTGLRVDGPALPTRTGRSKHNCKPPSM